MGLFGRTGGPRKRYNSFTGKWEVPSRKRKEFLAQKVLMYVCVFLLLLFLAWLFIDEVSEIIYPDNPEKRAAFVKDFNTVAPNIALVAATVIGIFTGSLIIGVLALVVAILSVGLVIYRNVKKGGDNGYQTPQNN